MFIVIEGIDKTGKSTQVKELSHRIRQSGVGVVEFGFPCDGTPTGKLIRKWLAGDVALIKSEMNFRENPRAQEDGFMFQCIQLADKYAAAFEIEKAQDDGNVVICARWCPSAYAYGIDSGIDSDWLLKVQSYLPEPDINILLDLDPVEAAKRSQSQSKDRIDRDLEKQKRLRDLYLKLWDQPPQDDSIWRVVSASGSIKEVHERIWSLIDPIH